MASGLFILFSNHIVDNLYHYSWGHYPKAGKYHPLFVIHFHTFVLIFFYGLLKYISNPKNDKLKINQSRYIILAFLILLGACLDFLPTYGIDYQIKGHFPALLFMLVLAFAILKHQLMDITIVFRKSLVYTSLITILTLSYLLTIYIFENMIKNFIGYKSLTLSILSAFTIGVLFIPLRNKIQQYIDKLFFKGTHFEISQENLHLKSVATLASGMAHEIKNPLTPIKIFTEQLPHRLNDKAFLIKFADIVSKEVDRIDTLVHELLDFAKPSPPALVNASLIPIIENILDFLNSDIINHKITVHRHYDIDKNILVTIDPKQIKQALLNILLNAIDAMPQGGKLSISLSKTDEFINIQINDTGYGIDNADLPLIFDPFFTKKKNGTGLGLSITHEIIRNHNGNISAISTKNIGTTFIINLPYKE